MEELKKAKTYRLVFRILFFLVAIVIPAIIMITRFELTHTQTKTVTHVTFYGVIVAFFILAILWKYKDQLMEWINKWEYSYAKYVFLGFSKIWVFLLILAVLLFTKAAVLGEIDQVTETVKQGASDFYKTLEFCVAVVCIAEAIAYLVIYPLENKYDEQVKRITRKNERKEDYKEAIKEMQEEGD